MSTLTLVTLADVNEATDDVGEATNNVGEVTGDYNATGNVSKEGRSKGSTYAHKREMDAKYQECVKNITEDYSMLLGMKSK